MTLFDQPTAAAADPLAASTIPVRAPERRIYDLIASHRGHANPIAVDLLHRITGMTERAIKDAVAELIVTHSILIGATRHKPFGYFIIESDDDRAAATAPLKGQVIQMLRRLRVINGKHQTREWLGQLSLQEDV